MTKDPVEAPLMKLVSDENGVRLEPLSEAELKQRKIDEEAWTAGEPARIAEAARQAQATADFTSSLQYEHRIVAFIDVLGWSEAIRRSVEQPNLIKTLGIAQQLLATSALHIDAVREMYGEQPSEGTYVTQFSDTIIVSAPFTIEGLTSIQRTIWFITNTFLERGLLIRGAIVAGSVYHRASGIFGPALLKAHEGEKAARYPRVTLDPSLTDAAFKNDEVVDSVTREVVYRHKTWRKDRDGVVFFDFLQPLTATTRSPLHEAEVRLAQAILTKARSLAVRSIAEFSRDARTREKHEWLLEYASDVANEFGLDFEQLSPEGQ